ncbi:autotransporter-associated beta strand repeat-containing protein [Hyphomicrobium sulfonivorans]|uniref:autotransporter-associated beta strand repeat-containing protein n=1 Tax=Hyphomicrobium sulfonivorans TaxID=121290 RepID=UPI00156D4A37|nr:autotransporter-associated beta strand repeat-containing protein [Hyphomicrobium sulfonivorans]
MNGLAITNHGTIQGGNGGWADATGTGTVGAGGYGIYGGSLSIVNSGTIGGGLDGEDVVRSDAIYFAGGTKRLELWAGWNIIGDVNSAVSTNTLALGVCTNSSFDVSLLGTQLNDFQTFEKVGTSTWVLSASNSAFTGDTLVYEGTLQAGQYNAFMIASPTTVMSGGTLDLNGFDQYILDLTNAGVVSMGAWTHYTPSNAYVDALLLGS